MNCTTITHQSFLTREFSRRKQRNPSYSLRSFARDLGIASSKLSQILKGSCGLSGKRAEEIAQCLGLSKRDTELFILCAESQHSRSRSGKIQARELLKRLSSSAEYQSLDLDRFSIIRDWYHFAILELTEVQDFSPEFNWIARRLGISTTEAKDAVERLLDFGLLRKDEPRGLKQTQINLATPSGIPSRELRDHHSQILRRAEESLEKVELSRRDISEVTMAIDSKKIAEASEWIKEFRRKFCHDIQASPEKDRVYCLAIQFFPLDKKNTDSLETP
jgi:uncharacterized protein (TIGR02147 family)